MLIQLTKSRDTTNKEINLKHIQSKHTQPLVSQVHHCALWKSEQDGWRKKVQIGMQLWSSVQHIYGCNIEDNMVNEI